VSEQFLKSNSAYLYFGNNHIPISSTTNEDISNDNIIDAFYKNINFFFSVPSKTHSKKLERTPTMESINIAHSIEDSIISDFITTAVERDKKSIQNQNQVKYFSSSSSSDEEYREEFEDSICKTQKRTTKSISNKWHKTSTLSYDDDTKANNEDTNTNIDTIILKEDCDRTTKLIEKIGYNENGNNSKVGEGIINKKRNSDNRNSDKKLSADFRNLFRIFRKKKSGKFKTILEEFEYMCQQPEDIDEIIKSINEFNELKLEMNVLDKIQFPYFKNVNLLTEFNTETISNGNNENISMVNYGKYLKEMKIFFLIWLVLLIFMEFCIFIAY
jgi:hypothetical protein